MVCRAALLSDHCARAALSDAYHRTKTAAILDQSEHPRIELSPEGTLYRQFCNPPCPARSGSSPQQDGKTCTPGCSQCGETASVVCETGQQHLGEQAPNVGSTYRNLRARKARGALARSTPKGSTLEAARVAGQVRYIAASNPRPAISHDFIFTIWRTPRRNPSNMEPPLVPNQRRCIAQRPRFR